MDNLLSLGQVTKHFGFGKCSPTKKMNTSVKAYLFPIRSALDDFSFKNYILLLNFNFQFWMKLNFKESLILN